MRLAREWMQRDPFAEIRFSLQPVKREMPEKAEIERLMHKEIDIPRLAQTRDLFIFCCFTGLAFSDIKQLAPEHIVTDMQGHRWIRKPRQKTGNMCNIPLLEIPARILQRYRTDPECVAHNRAAARVEQPEDERLPEGAGRHLRHPQAA